MHYIILFDFNLYNLESFSFFMKQARREDIHTLESKFSILSQRTFLIYDIFHKLLLNEEILVFCDCYFTNSHNKLSRISNLCLIYWVSLWGADFFFFTCSFSLTYFFSVLENNYNYFFHCIFVDDEKLYQYELYQRAKNQYDDKEILHGLRLINNGTSI